MSAKKIGATSSTRVPKSAKTRSKRPATEPRVSRPEPRITDDHWNTPATFTFDGSRMATLREYLDPKVPTKNLIELSEDQLVDLKIRRLEMEPEDFKLAMMGVGIVE